MADSPTTENKAAPAEQVKRNTIVIGISGPSSSGKTTLARLLRTVFTPEEKAETGPGYADSGPIGKYAPNGGSDRDKKDLSVFIVHEDDFYKPDDQIPVTTTASGQRVQDWDTIGALDVRQLSSTLSYVHTRGTLPPRLKSKEDLNAVTDSGVDDDTIRRIRGNVTRRLEDILSDGHTKGIRQQSKESGGDSLSLSLAFLEGFLLYAPPDDDKHPLRDVHDHIHVPLFLPAKYSVMKERREGRTGYVTIGPAPTPELNPQNTSGSKESSDDGGGGGGAGDETKAFEEDDDSLPPGNFWTDPPGYVDDIVWPRYISDHAWLLLPDPEVSRSLEQLKIEVGEGEDVREDVGVLVAPGKGGASMTELLEWGVREVLLEIERVARPFFTFRHNSILTILGRQALSVIVPTVGFWWKPFESVSWGSAETQFFRIGDSRDSNALRSCILQAGPGSQEAEDRFIIKATGQSRHQSREIRSKFGQSIPSNHDLLERMVRLTVLPLQTATTLINLFCGSLVFAQYEDRSPLASGDLGWKITTQSGTKSAMRIICGSGETVTKSESYYTCCPTTVKAPCALPTACSGNTLLYADGKKQDCKNNLCASVLLYERAPSENLLGTQLVCRYGQLGDASPWTVYRNFPDSTASTFSTGSNATDAAPAPTAGLPQVTNSDSPVPPSPERPSSKAWMAGVVVGILAGVTLIVLLGFCIARRKFQWKPSLPKDDDTAPVNRPSADDKEDAYSTDQAVELNGYGRAELHFDQRPVELSHFGTNVVEMPVQHDRGFVAELDGATSQRWHG
ncbi:ribosylnicotinamide kinase [Paracoccidioides brasiliensis Pb18]|uniref:Nicotinamide riboside kinase n=1 Tax=Paracoccidioides brasiliensis (strain Pb18) TaxID=502780 RepID=C1G3Z2_PARBD|nr:ribosylnicotinamide kinase [Paracoccidioides brasiliensis Pb18]EEH45508.1 hypothetical protein PADG_01658 [Paracoccidioides brasiliensis Pb18]